MPNFGVNDNDRRTAEAMERIWAARRKEQVMSEVLKRGSSIELSGRIVEVRETDYHIMLDDGNHISVRHDHVLLPGVHQEAYNAMRQRAEQADASADTYALLLRKLTKDATLLAAYRRSKNLDHRGVPVVSDVVLEMLRKEEAALGRAK